MATRIGSVELLAELKNELTPALKEIERDAESTGTKAGSSMSRIGVGTAAAAAGARAAVGAAFAAFATKGVRFNAMVESATIKFGAFFANAQASRGSCSISDRIRCADAVPDARHLGSVEVVKDVQR